MIKNNSLIFGSTGFIGTKAVSYLKNFEGSIITISRKKNPDFGSLVDQIVIKDFNFKNKLLNLSKSYIFFTLKFILAFKL